MVEHLLRHPIDMSLIQIELLIVRICTADEDDTHVERQHRLT